jgi:hypothetical protein
MASLAALVLSTSSLVALPRHALSLPAQFEARLTTTAHMIDGSLGYPPRHRRVHIWYDALSGRARADVSEGFDAGKSFVRLYGEKREYMVRSGEFPTCQRAYLGDAMPNRTFPAAAAYVGATSLSDGACDDCDHWVVADEGGSRVHIYQDARSGLPVRLTEEWLDAAAGGDAACAADSTADCADDDELWRPFDDGATAATDGATPLMTYALDFVSTNAPDAAHFELPTKYTHADCARQTGGFGYLHAFHHYLSF